MLGMDIHRREGKIKRGPFIEVLRKQVWFSAENDSKQQQKKILMFQVWKIQLGKKIYLEGKMNQKMKEQKIHNIYFTQL